MVMKRHSTKRLNTKSFIDKARKVHGLTYNYSLVDYKNNKTKIKIKCMKHGVFEQIPNNHLNYGCKTCGGTDKSNTKDFIEKSTKIHNNFYNYDKVNYINNSTKVTITCLEHGDFKQQPKSHLKGIGCPSCADIKRMGQYNITNAERNKDNFKKTTAKLYLIEVNYKGNKFLKIGITTNLKARFNRMPFKPIILNLVTGNLYDIIYLENKILKKFEKDKIQVEYFAGYTECFNYKARFEIKNKMSI